jgi:hypothetical protein
MFVLVPGSRFFPSRILDPGVKKAPDPGSATQDSELYHNVCCLLGTLTDCCVCLGAGEEVSLALLSWVYTDIVSFSAGDKFTLALMASASQVMD